MTWQVVFGVIYISGVLVFLVRSYRVLQDRRFHEDVMREAEKESLGHAVPLITALAAIIAVVFWPLSLIGRAIYPKK